jgi:uncharacterized protein (DUF1697 family)
MRRMGTYAALLRAVNVGGRNRVPMAELRTLLTQLGLEDVTTYVQSGNVVFRSRSGSASTLAAEIEKQIAGAFGVRATVLLRTPAQLRKIAGANPFLAEESDPLRLHVAFLDAAPAAKAKAQLDPQRSPPDRFSVRGSEIYLHLPNGAGRSKLTIDYFERRLGVRGTARNWKTVTKLLELVEG